MQVDSDDDLIESSTLREARTRGQPPDILATNQKTKSKPSASKINRNEYQPLLSSHMSDTEHDIHTSSQLNNPHESDFVHLSCNHFENDPEFNDFVKQVEHAIDQSILPQRIYEGSSGSYFCKNAQNVTSLI